MECPVCFEKPTATKFLCGHGLCNRCLKEWYIKCETETPSCPMCRADMKFPGMTRKTSDWEDERIENRYQEIYEEMINNTIEDMEGYEDDIMCILYMMEKVYNAITKQTSTWFCDEIVYFCLENLQAPKNSEERKRRKYILIKRPEYYYNVFPKLRFNIEHFNSQFS